MRRHLVLAVTAAAGMMWLGGTAHAAPLANTTYTVKAGDTLSGIGSRCGVDWKKIQTANRLANPNRISPGATLTIPGASSCAAAQPAAPRQAPAAPAAPADGNAPAADAAPAAVAAAPVAAAPAGFGYGIQVHAPDGDQRAIDAVGDIGFNWVKQQVEWFRYEGSQGNASFGGLDNLVNQANAKGINVMFSVAKAPDWARAGNSDRGVAGPPADPATMASFMGRMAEHFRGRVKAYEVWNEQNLHYEWGNEPLSAGRYVQLLCASYHAIKAADPGAVVVSGALTPTGINNGQAIDDVNYLGQMYAAGLRGCANAVGAHPSGYNKPATAGVGWSAPGKTDFSGHRSFYFQGTMLAYRNVMARYGDGGKKIWATEFGWASVENMGAGPAPGYGYAAQNSEGDQAQYLVDAFNMARRWGFVGPMFVWNLNFAPVAGNADEKAAFSIVRNDWAPRPAYERLKAMSK